MLYVLILDLPTQKTQDCRLNSETLTLCSDISQSRATALLGARNSLSIGCACPFWKGDSYLLVIPHKKFFYFPNLTFTLFPFLDNFFFTFTRRILFLPFCI